MKRPAFAFALAPVLLAGCGGSEPADGGSTLPLPELASVATAKSVAGAWDLTCDHPVDGSRDTAASVLQDFGHEAQRMMLPGPEGTEWPGVVLWNDQPERRLELLLGEGPDERITGVRVRDSQSRWRIVGLGNGSPLASVEQANGGPFRLYGFEWDYGGWVTDFRGGRLEQLAGGCLPNMRLGPDHSGGSLPDGVSGDSEKGSDEAPMIAAAPRVVEFGLQWR